MAFNNGPVMYHYNPSDRDEKLVPNDWIVGQYDASMAATQTPDALNPSPVAMRRFIGELDCPWFNAVPLPDTSRLPRLGTLDLGPTADYTSLGWSYGLPAGYQSPLSGLSSSYFSSNVSDRLSTPSSPPDSGIATWSPQIAHVEHPDFAFGGGEHALFDDRKPTAGYSCVALPDVQSYEDLQPEKLLYEDDTTYYGSYASVAHEGYQPLEQSAEVKDEGVDTDENDPEDDDYRPQSPNLRRRRPQAARSLTCPRTPSKISKRSAAARRSSPSHAKTSPTVCRNNPTTSSNRAFACALAIYGCTSTFGSKNEWKRHVNTQHMRLAYWRCDQCDSSNRKPNDFNRKDLFIQHVRRMHPDKTAAAKKPTKPTSKTTRDDPEEHALNVIAERCFRQDRSPPGLSGCHFCECTFEGKDEAALLGQWDKRLEHVAHHMEKARNKDTGLPDPSHWQTDMLFERWLVQNRIVSRAPDGGLVLA